MPNSLSRLAACLILAALLGAWVYFRPATPAAIKIGVIHAQTGLMAESERGLIDAARLAVDDLNASGGILGQPVELLLADSRSDDAHAALEAERLIRDEGVNALFACWTSSCRQAVRPVVERHQHLMFYPLQYEGMEQSPNIIYLGAAPNQQIIPGARWAMDKFGPRVYLLGSDYLFPRAANLLIGDLIRASQGQVLAERYPSMASTDFTAIVDEIRRLKPDVVLNTLNGTCNTHFFAALAKAGLADLPVVSFSIAEPELQKLNAQHFHPPHFAVWGYFQSLPDAANQAFVRHFKQNFGQDRPTSDPILSSYNAVKLWATAVHEAGTAEPAQVNHSIERISMPSPAGMVASASATRHVWRRVYVGQAQEDGQFVASEISEAPVRPAPFPSYRSRAEWLALVQDFVNAAPSRGGQDK